MGSINQLKDILNVNPPKPYSISDSAVNIKRVNKLDIDWQSLSDRSDKANYIKKFLTARISEEKTLKLSLNDLKGVLWTYVDYIPTNPTAGQQADPQKIPVFFNDHSGRSYAIKVKGIVVDEVFFQPFESLTFDKFWDEVSSTANFELSTVDLDQNQSKIIALDFETSNQFVSNELAFYYNKFKTHSSKLTFLTKLLSAVETGFIDKELQDNTKVKNLFSDNELLNLYLSNYSNLKFVELQLKKEIESIKNRLEVKGYILETDPNAVSPTKRKYSDVEFLTSYGRVFSFNDDEVEEVTVKIIEIPDKKIYARPGEKTGAYEIGFGGKTKTITEKKLVKKNTAHEISKFDDTVYAKIAALKSDAQNNYSVYVYTNVNGEFIPDNCPPLDEIMQYCNFSEEMRKHTVVVIKEIDFIDSINKDVYGAMFYFHPKSEILPSRYPIIAFKEKLDFKMSWTGLEIGKLLNSISLAPGESKNIIINNKSSYTSTISNSSKSFDEINSGSSTETTTEFEKLVTNEIEKTSESSSSLNANVSYGGAGAGGESKQSSKETIKDFTKNLNKVTNKVSNSLNKRTSLEITSTSSTTQQTSSDITQNSTVSNINAGRTLNLYYHQLNNRFSTKTFIERLDIELTSSIELIENSGIYQVFTLRISDLKGLFDLLESLIPKALTGIEQDILESSIVDAIIHKLDEYTDYPLGVTNEIERKVVSSQSINAIKIIPSIKELYKDNTEGKEKISNAKLLLSTITFDDSGFNESEVILDSGSFYLDSRVGVIPGTEDYSELMRSLEANKLSLEISKENALIKSIKIKNSLLESDALRIINIIILREDAQSENLRIVMELSASTTIKDWLLYIDGIQKPVIETVLDASGQIITMHLKLPLASIESLEEKLLLYSKSENIYILYI